MKRFFRSIGGKLVLFICCILCLSLLASSVLLAVFLLNEREFYTSSEAEVRASFLSGSLRSYGGSLVTGILHRSSPEADWGNAIWQVQDASGTVLCRSESAPEVRDWEFRFEYGYVPETGVMGYVLSPGDQGSDGCVYYTVSFALKEGLPAADELAFRSRLVHVGWYLRYGVFLIAFFALVLSIICFVGLMCVSARKPDSEELHPGALYRVPFDLMLAVCAVGFPGLCVLADAMTSSQASTVAAMTFLGLLAANAVLGLCMSAAGRIKGHTLLRNTVIGFCLRSLGRLARWLWGLATRVPLVWKAALGFVGLSLLEGVFLILCRWEMDNFAVFWCLEKLILFPLCLALALQLRRLQKGGEALAAGDLSYHSDTAHMLPALRRHGDNLNRIADGMSAAVDQRLRSERMKTELITNVSHDLKTPLTSLVNYSELISREAPAGGQLREYAEVLLRQSEKLKRLIEDLVEASKASTGNLEVSCVPCDAAVFLTQAAGEYEEKLAAAGLTLVTKQPERELRILADGRRMWRVFDNLMGNAMKYALTGTRVYLNLEEQDGDAVFIFKNTSREPLDLPAAELMERFVRGDRSRSGEGSGLGLSIAGSLAELQGGSLRLFIDGDLFKAMLRFPLVCHGD